MSRWRELSSFVTTLIMVVKTGTTSTKRHGQGLTMGTQIIRMLKKAIVFVCVAAGLCCVSLPANAQSPEEWFEKALSAEQAGDSATAIDLLNQAADQDPRNGAIFNNRAILYATRGQYEPALRDLDRAIKLNPGDPAMYVNRGMILERQGDLSEAVWDYSRALEVNPEYVPALLHRASLAAANQTTDAAVADLNQALKFDPRSVMAHLMLGRLKLAKGQWKEALKSFGAAVASVSPRTWRY